MFHENLRRLRKEKKLSQDELAKKLSISQQAVGKWENQQAFPSMDMLVKLARTLHVSIDSLIGNSPPPPNQTLWQALVQEYHLDKLDTKMVRFYLELPSETRDSFKKHLLLFMDYLTTDESASYEKYRDDYIKENALPYAARNGKVFGLCDVQNEFDAKHAKRLK